MKFKMKRKPKHPENKKVITKSTFLEEIETDVQYYNDNYEITFSINELLLQIEKYKNDVNCYDLKITLSEFDSPLLVYKLIESDENYEKRVQNYHIKLKEYENWYKENKEEIEKHLTKKESKNDKQKLQTEYEKELKQLQEKYKQLKDN